MRSRDWDNARLRSTREKRAPRIAFAPQPFRPTSAGNGLGPTTFGRNPLPNLCVIKSTFRRR